MAQETTEPAVVADEVDRGARIAAFAWIAVLPLGLAWALVAHLFGRWLAPAPNAGGIDFFPSIKLAPEPVEQTRYEIAAVGPIVAAAAIAWLATRPGAGWARRLLTGPAIAAQVVLAALVALAWSKPLGSAIYFETSPWWYPTAAVLIGLAAVAVTIRRPRLRLDPPGGRLTTVLCVGAGALLTAAALASTIYREQNIGAAVVETNIHMLFTMDEFAAVAYGLTPGVDFTAQYTNLLPYLGWFVFHWASPSVFAFTVFMAALTGTALMAVMAGFRQLMGTWWRALVAYVPFLSLTLWPVVAAGVQVHSVANYYAVMPLRYFGPLVTFGLLPWALRDPSRRRLLVIGAVAGLTLDNNLEFGLPTVIATCLAVAVAAAPDAPPAWRDVLRRLGTAAGGVALAIVAFMLLTLVRSGHLPDLGRFTSYARDYALAGLTMAPIEGLWGAYSVVFATFCAAATWGLLQAFTGTGAAGARGRVGTGLLIYTGVFGLGALTYWVGRSLPQVLVAIFCAWGLALIVLAWELLVRLRAAWAGETPQRWALVVPAFLVFAHVGLAVAMLQNTRQITHQVERLRAADTPRMFQSQAMRYLIRDCSPKGEHVMVLYPLGHRTSGAMGVDDVFPFNSSEQIVSFEDVDLVLDAIEDERVTTIYSGKVRRQVPAALRQAGWRAVRTRPNTDPKFPGAYQGSKLTVWRPASDPAVPASCVDAAPVPPAAPLTP